MESWFRISLILCTFGFLKELRPSEPFVTEYIVQSKNVTAEEIIHIAFPVSTYSSLASLAIILLITDILRYKPIVILEGICYVLAWGILAFTSGLKAVIVVELFYGIACSAELAYSTYIYAQVDKEYYKKVTSQTSSARLAGKFFGGLVAQLLITLNLTNYHGLNYITVGCVFVGVLSTFFLPSVKTNKQFYMKWWQENDSGAVKDNNLPNKERQSLQNVSPKRTLRSSISTLLLDLKTAYGNGYVLKWSLWWALASAGQYQVINYIQALWDRIREEGGNEEALYNGGVKAMHTFLSAVLSFGIGYTTISWRKWGEGALTVISIVQGLMLVWMARTESLYMAYASYAIFRTIHPVMITVASAEVAQHIRDDSYGLIFGINMFIALSLQTLLTLIVSDLHGLALNERSQYIVYGVCFIVLGTLIGISSISTFSKRFCHAKTKTGKTSIENHDKIMDHVKFTRVSQADDERDCKVSNDKTDVV